MKTRILPVLALASALSGCLSVLPEPQIPSALIALPADRAQAPADPLQADVSVYPPDSTRAFAGVDIAVRTDQEMVYLGDVRWVDAAPRLLQNAVVDSLAKAGGNGRAVTAQIGALVDYEVRWRIIDFSASRDAGPVRVEVAVSLLDALTRRMVAQDNFSTTATPSDRAPRARAAALALAAQSVADEVAGFVAKAAAPKQPPR
ncbi:MAG TPA: ABC-type transport auxiliary lipoprotein family protein [Hyphomonadaceae bacterium]